MAKDKELTDKEKKAAAQEQVNLETNRLKSLITSDPLNAPKYRQMINELPFRHGILTDEDRQKVKEVSGTDTSKMVVQPEPKEAEKVEPEVTEEQKEAINDAKEAADALKDETGEDLSDAPEGEATEATPPPPAETPENELPLRERLLKVSKGVVKGMLLNRGVSEEEIAKHWRTQENLVQFAETKLTAEDFKD